QAAMRVEDVIRMVDARGDRARHLGLADRSSQAGRRCLPLELAEFAAIALQRRYFFLFFCACGRVLLLSFPVLRARRAMQLGRIDALDADRHLAAVPNDGLLADEGILEDACTAEALRRGVFAELKAVRVDHHIGGADVGIAVWPELRQIDRAAD